jgi:putative oxidoreductase
MGNLGISFLPAFWGFMAAFSEFFCSIFLILGILFRPAALFLAFTMFIAALNHLNFPPDSPRAGFSGASHAIELMAVYIALLYLGSGKFTVTSKL